MWTERLQPAGTPFKNVFSFDSTDGKEPYASLIALNGALYGTTYSGGSTDSGTAFKVTASGTQSVLHNFKDGKDGALPQSSLVNVKGTLYGTTIDGGGPGEEGVVFKLTTSGQEAILHRFVGGTDGANPYAGLANVAGVLYGTTAAGGAHSEGTVFKITTSGKEAVVYSFGRTRPDGATPVARLKEVKGVLYGTTSYGGNYCGSNGCGTVFKITTSGKEKVLHSFAGGKDGSQPAAPLTDINGTLYGTTPLGGSQNAGTVFKITTSGKESVIYSFKGGMDGAVPQELFDLKDTLYGTTAAGGSKNRGTVFAITTSGKKSVLHVFTGGKDGAGPRAGLHGLKSVLYGTTAAGGAKNDGTIFKIKP
jgi:uncharacterized repeat protein (TIGR03803 family)